MGTLETATDIAENVAADHAARHDDDGTFPTEGVEALGEAGLLGLTVPEGFGGLGQGPLEASQVVSALARADGSLAMVYMMHLSGTACVLAAPRKPRLEAVLEAIADGDHLTTLAFSEKGSRSHFWAPVSKAKTNGGGVRLSAEKSFVTSAGQADSYVVTTGAVDGQAATDSTLYLVPADSDGLQVHGQWDGMGLRGNASAPMTFDCEVPDDLALTEPGGGFQAKLGTVLPIFNLASASVSLGLCQGALAATTEHLSTARFEHLDTSLGEGLPTLRANLGRMNVRTQQLASLVEQAATSIQDPDEATQLRVLQVKAAGGEAATEVTQLAMRTCGGAAFAKHTGIDRYFRDAQAANVMAPTTDVLYELIARASLGMELL